VARPRLAAALAALCLAAAPPLAAQVVRGELVDARTGRGLAGGTLTLLAEDGTREASARSDSAGAFLLAAARPGPHRLGAELPGYRASTSPALELGEGDTLVVQFRISQRMVLLDPVVVRGRRRFLSDALNRFYERAEERRVGSFIVREEVERRRPSTTTFLLATIPGVQLAPRVMGGGNVVLLRGSCAPRVYVDGIRVGQDGHAVIDDLVSPLDLEGVEVYRSAAELPVEYSGVYAGCGAILLWTRRGE
jgi:hypothetical protein